jgi:hypothetical protein
VPQTLLEMDQDSELQDHLAKVQQQGQAALTREERIKRQRSLDQLNVPSFARMCADAGELQGLQATCITCVQES